MRLVRNVLLLCALSHSLSVGAVCPSPVAVILPFSSHNQASESIFEGVQEYFAQSCESAVTLDRVESDSESDLSNYALLLGPLKPNNSASINIPQVVGFDEIEAVANPTLLSFSLSDNVKLLDLDSFMLATLSGHSPTVLLYPESQDVPSWVNRIQTQLIEQQGALFDEIVYTESNLKQKLSEITGALWVNQREEVLNEVLNQPFDTISSQQDQQGVIVFEGSEILLRQLRPYLNYLQMGKWHLVWLYRSQENVGFSKDELTQLSVLSPDQWVFSAEENQQVSMQRQSSRVSLKAYGYDLAEVGESLWLFDELPSEFILKLGHFKREGQVLYPKIYESVPPGQARFFDKETGQDLEKLPNFDVQ